jgi:hypothetical protein
MMGTDRFDPRNISITTAAGQTVSVSTLFEQGVPGRAQISELVKAIMSDLNKRVVDLPEGLVEEWVSNLHLVVQGLGPNLSNPYSDIEHYHIKPFSENIPLEELESVKMLDILPDKALDLTDPSHVDTIGRTLLILAAGGIDSTFYNGLASEEIDELSRRLYSDELVDGFAEYGAQTIIPRALAAKSVESGGRVSGMESMILHAYSAGIRNIAIVSNAKTQEPIKNYLRAHFRDLKDLNVIVTPQPLLPLVRGNPETGDMIISSKNGSYPGGHGHAFKYCLYSEEVRDLIDNNDLEYFIFSNSDNVVLLNWGANHFAEAITEIVRLKQTPEGSRLRIAFFLVWEYLRKGGFAFLLEPTGGGDQISQIIESELAGESGIDTSSLTENRGGYNTNVAAGILKDSYEHLRHLPIALKKKEREDSVDFLFECSLATAMTTYQEDNGASFCDQGVSINFLGPKEARYQHWNHIAMRKRDDFLAFLSSLFKVEDITTESGTFPGIVTRRDATQAYPTLEGNITDPGVVNTKTFFDIFKDVDLDVDDFTGTLCIDLLKEGEKPRGKITFAGKVQLSGTGKVHICVPADQKWIIQDKTFDANTDLTVAENDVGIISDGV